MSIVKLNPTIETPQEPILPKIEPDNFVSILQTEFNTPLASIISYIEGAPWTVNYYSQVTTGFNDVREQDIGQLAPYSQYVKINNFEIRVTTPIEPAQNQEDNLLTLTGAGNLYPFLTPNVGDMFLAAVRGGRNIVFTITNVERKTYNKLASFSIEYSASYFIDTDIDRYEDLENKVIRELYFNKDRLLEGQEPTLRKEENQLYNDLKSKYYFLTEYYFKTFYNKKYSTLLLPGQTKAIYDDYLVQFLKKIITTEESALLRAVKTLNTQNDEYLNQYQIWDILLLQDISLLNIINKEMMLVCSGAFKSAPLANPMIYTGIDYVVYPNDAEVTLNKNNILPRLLNSFKELEIIDGYNNTRDIVNTQFVDNSTIITYTKLVELNPYILSSDFYLNTNNQSVLETMIRDYLDNKQLDLNKLVDLSKLCLTWGFLEQYYYIPIILLLIKYKVKGLY